MKNCEVCGNEHDRTARTCSVDCGKKLRAQKMTEVYAEKGTWVTAKCARLACGKEFTHRRSKPRQYCGKPCYNQMTHEAAVESKKCAQCGGLMTSFKRQGQQFCSTACRNRATAAGRTKNYPECRICGVSTGSYNRTFCDDHRPKPGQKALPRKVAVCLGCGEEFSRPGSWRGKMNYCSNKCSHHEVKSVRDKFVLNLNDKAIVFHSGWEIRFVAVCMRLKIDWRRYDGPDFETPVGTYRPDFIIGPDDLIIEVKGWEARPGTPEKLAESGALVIGKAHLEVLEGCSYAETFWRAIEMLREPVVMA